MAYLYLWKNNNLKYNLIILLIIIYIYNNIINLFNEIIIIVKLCIYYLFLKNKHLIILKIT